jgi:TetR/AcrR family transcriptional regulator, mexCD-oprJ operon repressor
MSAQTAESARRPYGRRTDAERNRETILDHAARLLVDDPAAGMNDIASAAGVGRATLYRHFPTREELVEAIGDRAIEETDRAIDASRLEEGSAVEAFRRLIAALFEIGDRYVFLLRQSTSHAQTEEGVTEAMEHIGTRLVSFFERGQASGEFSRTLPAPWMTGMTGLVIVAVAHSVMTGRLAADQSVDVAVETLLNGLTGSQR